jgi:methyl-accepting chemotaxis protein WspA
MKKWIQTRGFFISLFSSSLVILLVTGLLWHGTTWCFLRFSDTAQEIRWGIERVRVEVLEMRSAEKDFFLHDLASQEFYERGESPNLAKHRALMTSVFPDIERLTGMTVGREKELAQQIGVALRSYEASFLDLVATYREMGYKDWGVEGEWRKIIRGLEQQLRDLKDVSLEVQLLQLRRNEKDFLLRGEQRYADAVYDDLKKLAASLRSAGSAETDGPLQALEQYRLLFGRYLAIREKIGQSDTEGQLGQLQAAVRPIDPMLEEISAQADRDGRLARERLTWASLGISVASLGIAALFFFFFARIIMQPLKRLGEAVASLGAGNLDSRIDFEANNELGLLARGFNQMADALLRLIGQVQRSGIQVNTSVNEIAATAKEQQATANEIAATTTEIGATAKEINATSKELVKTVNEVTGVAEQTATLASDGQSGLVKMEETMQQIMSAGASINAKLAVLNEKAGNINQVVTTITKVADQTNLLSLNAAIEAEKAGEYGRGFAVVATEIRRLADQTAVATFDIEQMVKEMLSAVSAGVMGMDKFSEEVRRGVAEVHQVGAQLGQIIQQVQALTPRFEVVNEGMQAQSTGAQQISDALAQLGEAARQTAESLRQSTDAIDQLNGASLGLKTSVEKFKLG